MADDLWRYAEPDGKQRALSLDDLQRSLSRGLLPTNVPVWRAGFADWTPAGDVSELRASVSAGARILPPKASQKPGRPIAQRGGAAATGEEPPSPPSYTPAKKARPVAPALGDSSQRPSSSKMRSRSSTLIMAGGAPARDHNPESEAAPINVPTPGGERPTNIITQPPPLDTGVMVPLAADSTGEFDTDVTERLVRKQLISLSEDESADTREIPALAQLPTNDPALRELDSTSESPAIELSSSLLLTDEHSRSQLPEISAKLLPDADNDDDDAEEIPESLEVLSDAEVLTDAEVVSVREPVVIREPVKSMPPPIKRGSQPSYSSLTNPKSTAPVLPAKRPSFPSREEVVGTSDVKDRIGLTSKPPPPPPDINPTLSSVPPPPPVPTGVSGIELRSSAPPPEPKAVVPLWGAIAAVLLVGFGVWFVVTQTSDADVEAGTTEPVATSNTKSTAATEPAEDNKAKSCLVSSSARPLVPDVWPVDLHVSVASPRIAIGYAKTAREAVAAELDPASLAVKTTKSVSASGNLTRSVAKFESTGLAVVPEFPNMTAGIETQRGDGNLSLGIKGDKLVRISAGGAQSELFTMPSRDVERLRISLFPENQDLAAYVYRAPGAVWLGTTKPSDSPQRFPSIGAGVGTPTLVSLSAKHVLAAWPDRQGENEPWGLRLVAYEPGKGNVVPVAFADFGNSGAMLAPALARIDDDHALLLWTLERASNGTPTYEVRGQLLSADAEPLGQSFVVSAADMSAGQANAAFDGEGNGTVAFLVSTGESYDLAVAGVRCK